MKTEEKEVALNFLLNEEVKEVSFKRQGVSMCYAKRRIKK